MQTRALLHIRYLAARMAGMAALLAGERFDPAVVESLRRRYGLDDPVPLVDIAA